MAHWFVFLGLCLLENNLIFDLNYDIFCGV